MQFGLHPYNVIYTTLIVTRNLQGKAILLSLYTKEIKDIETYSVRISRRRHFLNLRNVDVLNRKIGAARSVQSNFLNSVTHIAVLRTSFVKTNTLHRVTTKTPNLLRR